MVNKVISISYEELESTAYNYEIGIKDNKEYV